MHKLSINVTNIACKLQLLVFRLTQKFPVYSFNIGKGVKGMYNKLI